MMGPGATLSWSGDSMGFEAVGKPGAQAASSPDHSRQLGLGRWLRPAPAVFFCNKK